MVQLCSITYQSPSYNKIPFYIYNNQLEASITTNTSVFISYKVLFNKISKVIQFHQQSVLCKTNNW